VLAVEGGDDLTRAGWEERSNAVARGLDGRGQRVALLFDPRAWADFAVAYLGVVKAGGVAVLLSPGAAPPDLRRALSHSRAAGLLCPPYLVPPGLAIWVASPGDIAAGHGTAPLGTAAGGEAVVYPPAPLAPAWPVPAGAGGPRPAGELVHAWAPGSLAGLAALRGLLGGEVTGMATVATFDPDRLCALVERRSAGCLGLTPALAAALVASGALARHDLSTVRQVVLTGPPPPGLQGALPRAVLTRLPEPSRPAAVDSAPVAVSQEAMLWHEQFAPGSFNLPCLVRRYRGEVDVPALGWALGELARRHEPLRSTFAVDGGRPRQVAGDHGASLEVVDAREDEVADLLAEATQRPFDLVTGPLWEPRLVRLGPDDHLLVVRLHHTVFDDWSVDVFRRELSALYAARLSGAPSPLPEPATTFTAACRRQRARLDGPAGAEERAWWREELDGAPLAVQLPVGPGQPGGSEPVRHDLPPTLAAAVRAAAPGLRGTPFMTVLSAFSVLVAGVTGQDDLLLATVVAHRNQSDVEGLVGCFTKKVPLRLRVGGDPTFAELVARTRASLLGSLSHQGLAFDAAVQEGLGTAAAAHGAVPQVAVVFQGETPQQVRLALPGLVVGPYEVPRAARRERHFSRPERAEPEWGAGVYLGTFLILSLLETAGGMALVARGVFDRPAVARLLGDFESLLARLVADPSQSIGRVERAGGDDELDLRGLRVGRRRLERALARSAGASQAAVAVRDGCLVAELVPDGSPPGLADLRRALWAELPGAPWPAQAFAGGVPLDGRPDPAATLLAAMWSAISGRAMGPDSSYWQDFSFLQVLAEAREAGLAVTDTQVVRGRTPAMLAAAMRP
jgi:hypothetical protein